ncbi:hypothetical protein GCM10010287_12400 [Streptomyces variabilis]|uniref:Stress protein n=1 Tax=Streptomyces variabilis TaxID=67372 RepID=A0ABQ2TSV8_9ACTN|nr:hypothetical protein GCM10010265_23590 [Streptomyces griseoincarnatus]GGT41170.1 hypothetical protein GCM10010287_12400 [Streptomyces variabilis]
MSDDGEQGGAMSELVPGGNIPLPGGAVTVRVAGPFDVSALITDDGRKVSGDADFVFYNQPSAPGARLAGDTLVVDPAALRAGATRVTVAVSPEEPGTTLSALPAPVLEVTGPGGRALARFRPPRPDRETVLLLAEVYRRGDGWKLRALGQGYADGLAGLARDFGVDVEDDEGAVSTRTAPVVTGRAPVSPATVAQAAPRTHPAAPPRPAAPPSAGDDFLALVNSGARHRGFAAGVARRAAGRGGPAARAGDGARRASRCGGPGRGAGVPARGGRRLPLPHRRRAPGVRAVVRGPVRGPLPAARGGPPHGVRPGVHARRRRLLRGRRGHVLDGAVGASAHRGGPGPHGGGGRRADQPGARAGRASAAVRRPAADHAAAQAHSADMVARDFYAHTAPDGSKPWDRAAAAGSRCRTVGENIACGQRSAAEVVRGWMNSPGHRANILKPEFTHIGVGFAGGGRAGTYWTQVFGG